MPGKRCWTEAETEQARRMRRDGCAFAEIAARIGRTEKAVRVHLARLARTGRPRRKPWTEAEIDRVRRMCAEHRTPAEIAERIGRTEKAVRVGLSRYMPADHHFKNAAAENGGYTSGQLRRMNDCFAGAMASSPELRAHPGRPK